MPSLDYSRFDHIGDSDDDEGPDPGPEGVPQELLQALALQAEAEGAAAAAPRPPDNVLEDTVDYFERWDARRAGGADPSESASAASVERFEEDDFARLDQLAGLGGAECAICLASGSEQEPAVVLPCAARHRFHEESAPGAGSIATPPAHCAASTCAAWCARRPRGTRRRVRAVSASRGTAA
ncbi:unnamed protein product [Prorocentrum cordatum]|uniref:E3 ubiquitin-protein ligase n=1 Tax=Prorocentrum cordatum TaxID=2364126 RepID=A0ABN9VVJ7_9DINO|nr:unnamed protein product [Polarella glacialis]